MQILIGFLLALLIGAAAYYRRSLSGSGFAGAVVIGTLIFGMGGWQWGIVLIAFFVSSSALSQFKAARKERLAEKFAKGSRRDLAQTLANGGLGAFLALASYLWPHPAWWAAFVGAMATVTADTWATELGVLSRSSPRLITTWRPTAVGTSGGVSTVGLMAALGGAAFIGILAVFLNPLPAAAAILFAIAGWLGSLFDSLLGASVQAIYFCDLCSQETERHPRHTCGHPTRLVRGWSCLDNDRVNFLSSIVGALLAAACRLCW